MRPSLNTGTTFPVIGVPSTLTERKWYAATAITAGICEELLFRGFLMRYLPATFPTLDWLVVAILSGIIYGLSHAYQGIKGIFQTALTGFSFAIVYVLGGSLLLIGVEVVSRQLEQVKRASVLTFISVFVIVPFAWQNSTFLGVRLNVDQSFENVPAEQQSIGERGLLIRSANRIFVEHPINGIGLAAAPLAMKDYYPDFPVNYQPPHYTLLAVAVETGLIGAVFYFFLMTLPAFTFFSKRKTFVTQPVMVACAALLLAVVIVGFFDYYTWSYDPGRLWQWLAWVLWSAAVERAQ